MKLNPHLPITLFLAAALATAAGGPAVAADATKPMDHGAKHAPTTAETALIDGVVKKVDKASGKLTISHGPLPNGMPAMTMAFKVRESAWLGKVKDGQKVRFGIDDAMTIVRLDAAS
jgi:Cu(I)/Ag(I) efflux system periplasmic protein CusF